MSTAMRLPVETNPVTSHVGQSFNFSTHIIRIKMVVSMKKFIPSSA